MRHCSWLLISEGSANWSEANLVEDMNSDSQPAWNFLPQGIEGKSNLCVSSYTRPTVSPEELFARRQYYLEAISSIQRYFISLYSAKTLQCKKGYANSKECDSFQLGEMVKFFLRRGTISMCSMYTEQEPEVYHGPLSDLLRKLKACPSYQLDTNHAHCGVRQRMKPLLDELLALEDQAGICLECWRADRMKESWSENPTGGKWSGKILKLPPKDLRCCNYECTWHIKLKTMFTADEREWTPQDP